MKEYKKYARKILFVIIIVILCIVWVYYNSYRPKVSAFEGWKGQLAAHAGGSIDGYTYTNSLEAIEKAYSNGYKVIEVDLYMTSDEEVVCVHDWGTWNAITSEEESDRAPTMKEFLEKNIYEKYTPISFEDLVLFMKENEDVYIYIDGKYTDEGSVLLEYQKIVEATDYDEEILGRLLICIYTKEMHDVIYKIYPFPNMIFASYMIWDGRADSLKPLCEWCKKANIGTIDMWDYFYNEEIVKILKRYGINAAVFTVDDITVAQDFFEKGVKLITTNTILPSDIQ